MGNKTKRHDLSVIEQVLGQLTAEEEKNEGKEELLYCPVCNKPLYRQNIKGKGLIYTHIDEKCKLFFHTKSEIIAAREFAQDKKKEEPKSENSIKKMAPEGPEPAKKSSILEEPEIVGIVTEQEIEESFMVSEGEVKKTMLRPLEQEAAFGALVEREKRKKIAIKMKEKEESQEALKETSKPAKQDAEVEKPATEEAAEPACAAGGNTEVEKNDGREYIINEKAPAVTQVEKRKETDLEKNTLQEENNLQEAEKIILMEKAIAEPYHEPELPPQREDEEVLQEDEITELLYPEESTTKEQVMLVNLASGEKSVFSSSLIRIGKIEGYELRLDANRVVSKNHAEIHIKNGTCYLMDTRSRNGTFLNNFKIPPETEVEIKHGQTIRFANEEFRFEKGGRK